MPIGRFGSLSPARARRTALDSVVIASSWPMIRSWSASSILSRRSDSSPAMRSDRDAGPHRDDLGDVLFGHVGLFFGLLVPDLPAPGRRSASRSLRSRSRSSAASSNSWLSTAASSSRWIDFSPAIASLQAGRRGRAAHAHPRRRLVDQVDRLVRHEAVGDVARRQARRGLQRLVADLQPVVLLVERRARRSGC